jgi:general secretion pathway protein C
VDAILGDYASLMRGTRMRPVKVDGKLVGLRLSGIRADSLLGRLGWRDGDQVQSINGFLLTSPDKALEAYARLRTADHLVVRVVRGGKTLNLDYRIR